MRWFMPVFASTLFTGLLAETAAIAQVNYYPCQPTIWQREAGYNNRLYWGTTQRGERLELNVDSLRWVETGVFFMYYVDGQAMDAFTTCRTPTWRVGKRHFQTTSPSATRMLDYICGSRRR